MIRQKKIHWFVAVRGRRFGDTPRVTPWYTIRSLAKSSGVLRVAGRYPRTTAQIALWKSRSQNTLRSFIRRSRFKSSRQKEKMSRGGVRSLPCLPCRVELSCSALMLGGCTVFYDFPSSRCLRTSYKNVFSCSRDGVRIKIGSCIESLCHTPLLKGAWHVAKTMC